MLRTIQITEGNYRKVADSIFFNLCAVVVGIFVYISWSNTDPIWLLQAVPVAEETPIQGAASFNVVSYSLYGGAKPRYTDGAIANADLMSSVYTGWEMRVYHDGSVPKAVLDNLRSRPYVTLMNMQKHSIKNQMVWRFLVASDPTVERYVVRDIDSRLSMREKAAVGEWIESGKMFHVMRDHPSHSKYTMSGGMWGGTRDAIPDMEARLERRALNSKYLQDMNFLNDEVWPIAQKSVVQHDSFSCDKFGGGGPFPTARVGWEHVGSVYIGGKMRQVDVGLLKRAGVAAKCTTAP